MKMPPSNSLICSAGITLAVGIAFAAHVCQDLDAFFEVHSYVWPPSRKSAPQLGVFVAMFVVACWLTFFRSGSSPESKRVRFQKKRLLLAQMTQALKWDAPEAVDLDATPKVDKTATEKPKKKPPTTSELFDMLYDKVEERHVAEYGIDPKSDVYEGVFELFKQRVGEELRQAVKFSNLVRNVANATEDEQYSEESLLKEEIQQLDKDDLKLVGEYRDGTKLADLIDLCEDHIQKRFGKELVPADALKDAISCRRQLGMKQREGILKLAPMLLPLLPTYFFGCALMIFDSFVGAALWHSLSTVLDGVDAGTMSMDELKVVSTRNYITFIFCIFSHLSSWAFTGKVRSQFRLKVRSEVMRCLVRQDTAFFDIIPSGALQERLNHDTDMLAGRLFDLPMRIIHITGLLLSNLYSVYLLKPQLFAIIFGPLPVISLVQYFIIKALERLEERQRKIGEESAAGTMEILKEIRTVREFAMEDEEADKFNATSAYRAGIEEYSCAFQHIVCLPPLICTMCGVRNLVTFVSGYFVLARSLTVGQACQISFAADHLQHCIRDLMFMVPDIVKVVSPLERICDLLTSKPKVEPRVGDKAKLKPGKMSGKIEFRNVDFTFPSEPNKQILHSMTFTVNPGDKVAFVGSSGCGKSTSIKLIERFYAPTAGEILLDGVPIGDYDLYHLRRQMSIVAQDNVLFSTTLRENITYGLPRERRETITDAEVEEACVKANAWSFIQDFPRKLETYAGERGVKLSGGQKQRLAIARAIIREPTILLLDEATSALDSKSEGVVQAALDRMTEANASGCTITIAHRLATIRKCHRIYVIDKGCIVEQGPHDELLAIPIEKQGDGTTVKGRYRDLWETQMGQAAETKRTEVLEARIKELSLENMKLRTIAYKLPEKHVMEIPKLGHQRRPDAPTFFLDLARAKSATDDVGKVPGRVELKKSMTSLG